MIKIALDQFPIAPQANNMFPTVRVRGVMRRVKSGEYKSFENKVMAWAMKREEFLQDVRLKLQRYVGNEYWIQTHMFFCLPPEKIFTQGAKAKNALQKWDACNRVKATHDALSKLLCIDDRHFAVGAAEKVQISEPDVDPYALIVLQPATMIQDKHIIEEVLGWAKSIDRSIL